jgi:hypothetical protein
VSDRDDAPASETSRLEAYIERTVAAAPELSGEQRDRLAVLLRGCVPPPGTGRRIDMSEAPPASEAVATTVDVGGPRHAKSPTTVARSA